MENQHFVPKAYLKHFCKMTDQDLYAVKFINNVKRWSLPRSRNISTFCYKVDYYNLDKEQTIENSVLPDYIERTIFWYERTYFDQLISKTLKGELCYDLINELPKFFLNMKHRNPVFRNSITKETIQKSFTNIIPSFKEKFNMIDESLLDELIKKNEQKLITSENIPKKMHTNSLLDAHKGKNETYEYILSQITNYNIVFYEISSEDDFFLTSDSPGFSVDINQNVHKIKFKDDMFHFMPLHPKLAVGIMNPRYTTTKEKVSKVIATKLQIEQINFGTTISRYKYLFGYDYEHLKQHTIRISNNSNDNT